jgi:hypothetical protein
MLAAAEMFQTTAAFRDRSGLAERWRQSHPDGAPLPTIQYDELRRAYDPVVAFDNLPSASSVYGYRLAAGPRAALVVGNERRGLAHDVTRIATHRVQIPLVSQRLSSLNVAAAAAVGLYILSRGGGAAMQTRAQPQKRRPELLLKGVADHWELGSAVRSAGAFGWQRLLLEDTAGVWFGVPRGIRAEGRAAARRQKNPIRVVPLSTTPGMFERVRVITTRRRGTPLHRAQLAGGPRQIIVLADECAVDLDTQDWHRLGNDVDFVHLDLPSSAYPYHFRLVASIALAEIARQVGLSSHRIPGKPPPPEPIYDRVLRLLDTAEGETIFLDDLAAY